MQITGIDYGCYSFSVIQDLQAYEPVLKIRVVKIEYSGEQILLHIYLFFLFIYLPQLTILHNNLKVW